MLSPELHPELVDLARWLEASEPRKRAVLDAVAAELGPDFAAVYGDPAPVDRPPAETWPAADRVRLRAELALPSLQGGLRIEHRPSFTLFCLVPGGTTELGLSDDELAIFDSAAFLDTERGEQLWRQGELHALHRAAPFMRGSQGQTLTRTFAPFLMAECPLSGSQLEALGVQIAGRKRVFAGPDSITYVEPDELAIALHAPMRLPTEAEWEHACRGGTHTPFHWGEDPPEQIIDPLHPLGLSALGHFAEAVSDPWRRHLEAPADNPELGTCRGGAAAHYPWPAGAGTWQLLLSAFRSTWHKTQRGPNRRPPNERQVALRPVIPLPCRAPEPRPRPRPRMPSWRPARRTNLLLGRMMAATSEDRAAARKELLDAVSGFGIWTGQGVAAFPWVADLVASDFAPDRHRLLMVMADLACGHHNAVLPLGLDRTQPSIGEAASHAPARALRALLAERVARLGHLATDPDPRLRSAFSVVASLLPESEPLARPLLTEALAWEPLPAVRASLLLAMGRVERWARRVSPALFRPHFDDPDPRVAGAARLGLLACDHAALADGPEPLAPAHEAALMAFIRDGEHDPELLPWNEGLLGPLCAKWVADHHPEGPPRAGALLSRLVREAGLADDPRLESWAGGAIRLGLTAAARRTPEQFDELRWRIVSDLARRDWPSLANLWIAAGLPADMGERRTLVARFRGRV